VAKLPIKKVTPPMLFYGKILLSITQLCKGAIKVLYFAVHRTGQLSSIQYFT
jgi:hypothetical protein